jgi:hypothetical protein
MPEPAVDTGAETPTAEPTPTPFAAVLHQHRGSGLHNELGEQLANITAAVIEFQKKGTLTLTLEITPADDDMNAVVIRDDWKAKVPRATPQPSRFFSDEHGTLSRRDPRQPEIEGLRDASK